MNQPQDGAPPAEDLYALLQVSPRADAEVIEAAYRVLARRYHPDRNRSPEATRQMARLNGAWETLRDPARRAAYDGARGQGSLQPPAARAPSTPRRQPATARRTGAETPALHVEPGALAFGPLRQGARREAGAAVFTEPAGIRVEVGVAEGSGWLTAGPAVLKGLEKEQIGIDVCTRRLPPGLHHGAIALRTSWETRLLPVEVEVLPAPLRYRIAALTRGAGGEGWRGSTVLMLLVLLLITAGLAALALGR